MSQTSKLTGILKQQQVKQATAEYVAIFISRDSENMCFLTRRFFSLLVLKVVFGTEKVIMVG